VISISHRLEFLSKTGFIFHIQEGNITEIGTYDDLKLRNE